MKEFIRAITPPILFAAAKSLLRRPQAPVGAAAPSQSGTTVNGGRAAYSISTDARFARARRYGLDASRYSAFMDDPDGATKIAPLFVYGANKQVRFPPEAKWFIIESMFEDAYFIEQLPMIDKAANLKIIDIGANAGAFTVAARTIFPMATIHCYEPNPDMKPYLDVQAFATRAKVYMVGVGKDRGSFAIDNRQNEILGHQSVLMVDFQKPGEIPIIPFSECIANIGGYADIVKLDCEGSEWMITADPEPFRNVHILCMEYHRLPLDSSFDEFDLGVDIHAHARKRVETLRFDVLHHVKNSIDAGIIVARNLGFAGATSTTSSAAPG